MSRKGNVIFFVTSLQSGGIENYLLRFIGETFNSFSSITIFCKSGKGGQLEEQYKQYKNVSIIKHKVGYFSLLDHLFVYKLFKKNKYDTICDFTGNFSGLILKIAYKQKIKKRIAFYRNSSNRFAESFLRIKYDQWIKRLTFKYSTKILANSYAALNFYFSNQWEGNNKFMVIYNGVNSEQFINEPDDLREELKLPENAFVIGHTGRYNPAKNHSTILKVGKQLIKQENNIYFILCGNGVKDNLEIEIKKNNLEDRIILFNNRNDIPKFLKTLDCYYFPSITEGQPNSLIEAMVSNLPIVASDIAPIKETVPRDFHNNLIPPLSVEAAIEKILEIYNERTNPRLQEWAIENFNSNRLFAKFLNQL